MNTLLSVAIAAMLPASIASAQPATYYGDGYSIVVPEGWTEMPREVLELVHQFTNVEYVTGFANPDAEEWLDHPYVLVKDLPAPEESIPVTKALAVEMVRFFSGMDMDEAVRELEAPLFDSVELAFGKPDVSLQWDRRQFCARGLMTVDESVVRYQWIGHFGFDKLVCVYFYALADEWSATEVARFHSGFAFDTPIPDVAGQPQKRRVAADSKTSTREFIDGHRYTFSTKDHPKAKGVHFTIALPNSWAAAEGDRPNIVQKFVSEGGRGFESVMITTKDLPLPPGTVITEQDKRDLFVPSELRGMLPPGATFIDALATKIEGTPAGLLEYKMRMDRVGMSLVMYTRSLYFLSGNTLVIVQCATGGFASSEDDVARRSAAFKPLFTLILNSVIFPDKWTAAPQISPAPHTTQYLAFDDQTLLIITLVVSFIVTWGVGLTAPLVIRYAIIRRPLSRKAATWIAAGSSAFLWLAFQSLHHALGEEPGRGFVWVLMFFVARWIMSRGYDSAATLRPTQRRLAEPT